MKSRRLFAAVVLAMLMVLVLTLPASAAPLATLEANQMGPATAAHIHVGFRGEAGPIVVPLNPPTDGSSSACVEIPRALSLELREHPNRYYVNVHNNPFPDGAIRGQLHRQ